MPAGPVVLATVGPLAVAGTVASLALFLSLTAHIAARNVLGDVEARKALGVGPIPAAIAVVFATFELPPAIGVGLALVADAALIRVLYGRSGRLTAYITLIHVVVSIILGTILFGLYALALSAPG